MYKKYDKIMNKGFKLHDFLETGLYVEEKLDGANASFTYDVHADKMRAFSRNTELSEGNTLSGFYEYVRDLESTMDARDFDLLGKHIVFGEWMNPHKVKYKDWVYKKLFVFDVYSKEKERYLGFEERKSLIGDLSVPIPMVPVMLYCDPSYIDSSILDNISSMIGVSELTQEKDTGEGIVVKSIEGKGYHEDYYKFVTKTFKESKGVKKDKPSKSDTHIVDYAITRARLEKIIHKQLDENNLNEEDLTLQQFGKVMKTVAPLMMEDILEEEMDALIKQIKQRIGKQIPNILRPILEEKDMETSDIK